MLMRHFSFQVSNKFGCAMATAIRGKTVVSGVKNFTKMLKNAVEQNMKSDKASPKTAVLGGAETEINLLQYDPQLDEETEAQMIALAASSGMTVLSRS